MEDLRIETSWDDGSHLDIRIFELLKEYGIPGIFYIVIDWIDQDGYLTWKQVQEIDKHPLTEIGCHTMSHPNDLKQVHDDYLEAEIAGAKGLLESILDRKVTKFCYPRGRYNNRVKRMVDQAGFIEARTTKVGALKYDDPLEKPTTVHVYDRNEYRGLSWFDYAEMKLNETLAFPNRTFHLWGHSWEVNKLNQWKRLEEFLSILSEYNG